MNSSSRVHTSFTGRRAARASRAASTAASPGVLAAVARAGVGGDHPHRRLGQRGTPGPARGARRTGAGCRSRPSAAPGRARTTGAPLGHRRPRLQRGVGDVRDLVRRAQAVGAGAQRLIDVALVAIADRALRPGAGGRRLARRRTGRRCPPGRRPAAGSFQRGASAASAAPAVAASRRRHAGEPAVVHHRHAGHRPRRRRRPGRPASRPGGAAAAPCRSTCPAGAGRRCTAAGR